MRIKNRSIKYRPSRRIIYLTAAITYWFLSSLLHLKVSLFLISPLPFFQNGIRPSDLILPLSWVAAASLLSLLSLQLFRHSIGWGMILCVSLWSAAVLAANFLLVSTSNEYIHYPQYAFLAILLQGAFSTQRHQFPITRIFFWAVLLGIADEAFQYFYICPSYGDYLDFNDFVLNELGAIGGIIIAALMGSGANSKGISIGRKELTVLTSILIALAALSFSGILRVTPPHEIPPGGVYRMEGKTRVFLERKPHIMGSRQKAQGSGGYYVLTVAEGTAVIVSVFLIVLFCEIHSVRRLPA